ncbi:hypothetical protein NMG60_11002258 [Bertholletia excelsa]
MRNDGQKPQGSVPRTKRTNGFIPTSFRALSRFVSSGALTVASTVRSAASAASAIVDRDSDGSHDQVLWAGFDKLEWEGDTTRQVLLLGYRSGFQVWDIEEPENVHILVSRHDGPISFMQVLPKPNGPKKSEDKFVDSRPLLAVCADGLLSGGSNVQDALNPPCNGSTPNCHDSVNGGFIPTIVCFYSLRCQSCMHVLKFRSAIFSVRCSSQVVAVLQAAQIHCFDAATLERDYTILTNPIVAPCSGFGGIGYGPLAVGSRWLAYTGSPVAASNSGRVDPQDLTPSASFPGSASNGSLVVHYAKESSKQLAAGIVTLGDMGYKKLSRYYSELLPEANNSAQSGNPGRKVNGTVSGHLPDVENVGMVIVRDLVSKSVIAQFKAHKSPISSLCFDPSGTLLVTASVQGHNINVFQIMPWPSGSSGFDSSASYIHLYRLQRGFTNAVIQDISFSDDSHWIMISSSRGTSHLFAISPSGESVNLQFPGACFTGKSGSGVLTRPTVRWPPNSGLNMLNQQSLCASSPPLTLSVVSRIRSGNSGWRNTVTGAAAAATGKMNSLSGAIASAFYNCKSNDLHSGANVEKEKYHLMVFSSSGCMVQYALQAPTGQESATVVSELGSHESATECDARLVVDAIQKWNICQKQNRREREDNVDIYGENGNLDSCKIFPEGIENENGDYAEVRGSVSRPKLSPEERHRVFYFEAELQTHQALIPLWTKPEIYFQWMSSNGIKINGKNAYGGEIEIERIPTCTIEARSKDLVPVFDHLHTPKSQKARTYVSDSNANGRLLHQMSGLSENGRVSCHYSSGSLESMSDGASVAVLKSGTEETGWMGLHVLAKTTKGIVNNDHVPTSDNLLETVNIKEGSKMDAKSKFVNNNIVRC